jgi:hypothetical protein
VCCEVIRPEAFESYSALITFGENEITRSMDQNSISGTDLNKLSAVKKEPSFVTPC